MSYVLYSAIARAGGIDLMLGMESFARPHDDAVNRRPEKPYASASQRAPERLAGPRRPHALAGLRRQGGKALIGLGQTLTHWGRRWAPQNSFAPANTNVTFAAQ